MTLTFTDSQRELLRRAVAWEKKHPGESWTWRDVELEGHGQDLVGDADLGDTAKLLVLGFLDIVGEEDPAGHLLYLLTPAGREQAK